MFKKRKSCRSRGDMKNALVIGFWEANGVEIWSFPFPKQGVARKLSFFNSLVDLNLLTVFQH